MERESDLKVLEVIKTQSGPRGATRKAIMQYTGISADELEPVLQRLVASGAAMESASSGGGWRWYSTADSPRLKRKAAQAAIVETNYRRGYGDGYIVAVQDVCAALGIDPPADVWGHWQQALLDWVKASCDERIEPPALGEGGK